MNSEPPPPVWYPANPCGCGHCNVCGYFGMARKPQPQPAPPRPAERVPATLFD